VSEDDWSLTYQMALLKIRRRQRSFDRDLLIEFNYTPTMSVRKECFLKQQSASKIWKMYASESDRENAALMRTKQK